MMKIERLALGLALVASGVFGSPPLQHLPSRSRPATLGQFAPPRVHSSGSAGAFGGPAIAGQLLSASACTDGAYRSTGYRWSTRLYWRFRAGSRPKGWSSTGTAAALARAANNITNGRNNCGLADAIGATNSYRGTTSSAPNISPGGRCRGRDGRNVVGFGTLPSGYLGMTCWWSYNGRIVEADIKLNKAYYHWYLKRPSGCTRRWSVEAAATHEFGHAFGMAHVSESLHPRLTMSPIIRACQSSERTLGWGDLRGLQAQY
jgi:hypothetical protein